MLLSRLIKSPKMAQRKTKEKKVNQSNGLEAKESSGTLANPSDLEAWGTQEVSSDDIIIPRLLIMQGLSEFVSDDKAKLGDIVDSLNETVVGGLNAGVEILPFKCERLWKVVLDSKVVSTEPITAANADLPYECEHDGQQAKRFRTLRYYVLLPSELEAGGALPYVLEFKSTALRAGKKMYTQMYTKNRAIGLSPAAKTFMLTTDKVAGDKGTYAVPDVAVLRDSSDGEVAEALNWFKALKEGARVHEEE